MSPAALLLRGMKRLVDDDVEVVGMCDNEISLVDGIDQLRPDVVVVDDETTGRERARRVLARRPGTRVVALATEPAGPRDDAFLEDGGLGLVSKLDLASELVPAIEAALRGEVFVSQELRAQSADDGAR